ncbi:MHS family MFS transporter [Methylobacterium sp. J-088]|uniref:MFS transporter n=1 Tax=Methylobacterium sp. J-088 TaxID=2836664 RepID=UPI001FBB6E9A|nr:MFS transporter [Methylobacterium sp. J-088]MCJ2063308.1 MHS family MFS transporter [Methylobacterium sp. J-088]
MAEGSQVVGRVLPNEAASKLKPSSQPAPTNRVVIASAFGTIVEWYDFFVYGTAAALVFGKLFFPATDPLVSTLAAFSVYAVGYLARPLGGLIFGHFGDRLGRRSMLVLSLLLMGFGTFFVGLLPTYEQAGILAPICLVLLRLIQAIGLGGEWGGAVLMVAETAPASRRGLYGSFVQLGNPVGRLVATGVFALATRMPDAQFLSWGWRIPFLASIVLVLVGLFIRTRLDETPAFKDLRRSGATARMPVLEALTAFRRETVTAIGLKVTEVAWVGILTVFAVSYLTTQLGMAKSFVLDAVTLATLVELFVMPLSGWLSDKFGRRVIYLLGTGFGIAFAFPLFWLLATRDPTIVVITIVVGICLAQGMVFALHASFMPELFGTRVRYSGISLGFQIGAAIGGGLTPVIAAAAVGLSGGSTWLISLFLTILGVLTFAAVLSTRETSGCSMES